MTLFAAHALPAVAKAKKRGGGQIVLGKPTPTGVPFADANAHLFGLARVPLTAGKRAKGKAVDTVSITTLFSGSAGFGTVIGVRLTAPNGLTVGVASPPRDPNATNVGPTTETAGSPFGFCVPNYAPAVPPPPPCPDPDSAVGPPYAGTVGNAFLALFRGVPARGTWTLTVVNSSDVDAVTLDSIQLVITLSHR